MRGLGRVICHLCWHVQEEKTSTLIQSAKRFDFCIRQRDLVVRGIMRNQCSLITQDQTPEDAQCADSDFGSRRSETRTTCAITHTAMIDSPPSRVIRDRTSTLSKRPVALITFSPSSLPRTAFGAYTNAAPVLRPSISRMMSL